ncbi:hypothetical protein U1Q18_052718 [Sarracenia purpurea var. burkii]
MASQVPKRACTGVRGASSQGPTIEVSDAWATVNLHRMMHFPVEEFLRHNTMARVDIDLMNARRLGGLFDPFPTIYPGVVRLFFQNLRRDHRKNANKGIEKNYHTSVDGYDVELDANTLTETLDIHDTLIDDLSDTRDTIPDHLTLTDMAIVVFEGRSPPGHNFVQHGELAERLWFPDTILKANVFRAVHKDERRNENI